MASLLFLATTVLSSPSQAAVEPLIQIDAALASGEIRVAEAAYQQTYYLTADPRYDEASFGPRAVNSYQSNDCSATFVQRDLVRLREEQRYLDPYGLLWKPWLHEADRLSKQGDVGIIGSLSGTPIRLITPRGRMNEKAPNSERLRAVLAKFLLQYDHLLSHWSKEVFAKTELRPWSDNLSWPPDFLKDRVPYLESYFDSHPVFDAGRSKRWREPLEQFFDVMGVMGTKGVGESPGKLEQNAWTWILSDRIERNTLLWDRKGRSLLFLSLPCLERLIDQRWAEHYYWTHALREMLLHEVLLAYYLNGQMRSFLRDPAMDAVIQGVAQSFLIKAGPQYSHGPVFNDLSSVALDDEPRRMAERYGSAPLWNFLYRLEGDAIIKKYFKSGDKPSDYISQSLSQPFLGWVLGLRDMPAVLRAGVPVVVGAAEQSHPRDIELAAIVPPKGTIGSAVTPLRAQSFRLFHVPIHDAVKVAALNVRWEPVASQLEGYLFLAGKRTDGQAQFLDFTPVKPGSVQQVFLDPFRPPSEMFFFITNPTSQSIPGDAVQLQVSVVPVKADADYDSEP